MSENHVKPFLYGQRNFWISGGVLAFAFTGAGRRGPVPMREKKARQGRVIE
jgi:hypothetical protein